MFRYLGSTKLAFFLIAAVVLLLVISAIVPQRDFVSHEMASWQEILGENYVYIDRLGLDRIYFTPTFFITLGLLAINLLVGNIRRFASVYRIEKTLLKVRHLGSIVFHLSLLIIIAGVILNYLTKYHGVLALTEGQSIPDQASSYHREFKGPLYTDRYDRFALKLEDHFTASGDGLELGDRARVSLEPVSSEALEVELATNSPFGTGDLEFHYGIYAGYSPEILVQDNNGRDIFRSFLRVANQKVNGRDIHRDFVILPDGRTRVEVTVLPEPEAAAVEFEVVVQTHDTTLYEGTLGLGDTAVFASLELTVPRLRQWCYINVVESPWLDLVFVGFWLGLTGMSLSLYARLSR